MALAISLIKLGYALLDTGIEPNSSISEPDLDQIEFIYRLTQPQPARHSFLHITILFIECYIFISIYNALVPNLLHQVSKCFYHYIYQQVLMIIEDQAIETLQKRKYSTEIGQRSFKQKLQREVNAYFSQLLPIFRFIFLSRGDFFDFMIARE